MSLGYHWLGSMMGCSRAETANKVERYNRILYAAVRSSSEGDDEEDDGNDECNEDGESEEDTRYGR
jgi:hypothetical protein